MESILMEHANENCLKRIKDNIYILIILGIVAIITYGFEISNWTLTVDEEIWSHVDKFTFAKGWIGDGRWGIALLKLILPTYKVLPFFNGILAVIVLTASSFFVALTFLNFFKSNIGATISAVIFLTMPIHSYYLMFDTFSVEISIGIFCALLSAYNVWYAVLHNKYKKMIISLVLMTFSWSIYQSNFMIYTCFICALLMLSVIWEIKNKIEITGGVKYYKKIIIYSIGNLIIAFGIYEIIKTILQKIWGASTYINGYFRWSYVDRNTCLQQIKVYLTQLFLRPSELLYGGKILTFFFALGAISFITLLIKGKERRIIVILSYIALNLSICIEYIIMAGSVPLRSLPVIALYISVISFMVLFLIEVKYLKQIMVIFLSIIILYQSSDVIELFYSEYNRQEYDLAFLNRVVIKIEDLNKGEIPEEPVIFIGRHSWSSLYSINTEQFDDSIFSLGEPGRIYRYLMDLGYNYNLPTAEMTEQANKIAQNMPIWPYEGSVVCEDGMIIVNLGE